MMLLMNAIRWDGRIVRISTGYDLAEMIGLPIRLPEGDWERVEIVESKNGKPLWIYYI